MEFDFYTSDHHWGHKNIISYCNRPFSSLLEMHRVFVANYNKTVTRDSKVLWLGDCFFGDYTHPVVMEGLLKELKGKKYLLRGNHDKFVKTSTFLKAGFEAVFQTHFTAKIKDTPVRYSHYPYMDAGHITALRPAKEDNLPLVHGHTHEALKLTNDNTVHIGVDAWDFCPASVEDVHQLVLEAIKRGKNETRRSTKNPGI